MLYVQVYELIGNLIVRQPIKYFSYPVFGYISSTKSRHEPADLWRDIFNGAENAFDRFADTIKNTFLNLIAEMASAAIKNQIIIPIGTQMFGGSTTGSVGSSASSMFGGGGSLVGSLGTGMLNFFGAESSLGLFGGGLSNGSMAGLFGGGLTEGFSLMGAGNMASGLGTVLGAASPLIFPLAALALADLFEDLQSIHFGEMYIQEYQIERLICQQTQGFMTVYSRIRLTTRLSQNAGQRVPQAGLVVDDQNFADRSHHFSLDLAPFDLVPKAARRVTKR